jgi:hypothetical protein
MSPMSRAAQRQQPRQMLLIFRSSARSSGWRWSDAAGVIAEDAATDGFAGLAELCRTWPRQCRGELSRATAWVLPASARVITAAAASLQTRIPFTSSSRVFRLRVHQFRSRTSAEGEVPRRSTPQVSYDPLPPRRNILRALIDQELVRQVKRDTGSWEPSTSSDRRV